jgi:hypothetical protein
MDREETSRQFARAIDVLEEALRRCPDGLWETSMWHVARSDPWVWPREGVPPVPERTDESVQQFSAFCNIAYHCLWYLDFYATTDVAGFLSPEFVRGGPEEQGMAADGAAPVPVEPRFPRDVLLAYLAHGRRRVLDLVANATEEELAARCPPGHPHAGKSVSQLLKVNLDHVREHGTDMLAFVNSHGGSLSQQPT